MHFDLFRLLGVMLMDLASFSVVLQQPTFSVVLEVGFLFSFQEVSVVSLVLEVLVLGGTLRAGPQCIHPRLLTIVHALA